MTYTLQPLDIMLISKTTTENGQNVSIDFSPIVLKVSPHTVKLLSAVAQSMQAQQQLVGVSSHFHYHKESL